MICDTQGLCHHLDHNIACFPIREWWYRNCPFPGDEKKDCELQCPNLDICKKILKHDPKDEELPYSFFQFLLSTRLPSLIDETQVRLKDLLRNEVRKIIIG